MPPDVFTIAARVVIVVMAALIIDVARRPEQRMMQAKEPIAQNQERLIEIQERQTAALRRIATSVERRDG